MNYYINIAQTRIILLFAIGLIASSLHPAGQIISTAPGGVFANGYQSSLITTTTNLIRGTVICTKGIQVCDGYSGNPSSLLYDADGPVYGGIFFNTNNAGGQLTLVSDLRLGSTCVIRNGGSNISNPTASPNNPTAYMTINGNGQTIIMGNDLRLTFSTQFVSNCIIDGRGNTLTLQAPLVLSAMSTNISVTLKNMQLVIGSGIGGTNSAYAEPFIFQSNNQSQSINLCNVDFCLPTGVVTHVKTAGILNTNRINTIRGQGSTFKMVYPAAGTASPRLKVGSASKLLISQGVTFSLWGSAAVAQSNRLILSTPTSELWLDGCIFDISAAQPGTTTGLMLTTGSLFFDNKVTVSSTLGGSIVSNVANGLLLGDGINSFNDLNVRVRGGAYLNLIGPMQYNHS